MSSSANPNPNSYLGLLPIPPELKSITSYLQRADELKERDPVMTYWCAYTAAQQGISLKSKSATSRNYLFSLLSLLERLKADVRNSSSTSNANGSGVDVVEDEAASAAYVENFGLRVFEGADAEDRRGGATRATAKKFLAAANFLEMLKIFDRSVVPDTHDERIRYAKWKAADIAKAYREGRKPTAGPANQTQPEADSEVQPLSPNSGSQSQSTSTRNTSTSPPKHHSGLTSGSTSTSSSPPRTPRKSPSPKMSPQDIARANLNQNLNHPLPYAHIPKHLQDEAMVRAGSPAWSIMATPGSGGEEGEVSWSRRGERAREARESGSPPRRGANGSGNGKGRIDMLNGYDDLGNDSDAYPGETIGGRASGFDLKVTSPPASSAGPTSPPTSTFIPATSAATSAPTTSSKLPVQGDKTPSTPSTPKKVHFTPSVVGGLTDSDAGSTLLDEDQSEVGMELPQQDAPGQWVVPPPGVLGGENTVPTRFVDGLPMPAGFVPPSISGVPGHNRSGSGSGYANRSSPPSGSFLPSPPSHTPSVPPPPPPPTTSFIPSPPPSAPPPPLHSFIPSAPPAPPPTAGPPPELTPKIVVETQRHCRFAISALDYEDVETARKELRAALGLLGGL